MERVSVKHMKRGLSTVQKKVIHELVHSDVTGKTIAMIADEHNVTERTIYRWKNDATFATELEKETDINLKSFFYEANHKLKALVRSGQSEQAVLGAIKLVLQSQGKLRDVQELTTVNVDKTKEGYTTEDLDELEELLKE